MVGMPDIGGWGRQKLAELERGRGSPLCPLSNVSSLAVKFDHIHRRGPGVVHGAGCEEGSRGGGGSIHCPLLLSPINLREGGVKVGRQVGHRVTPGLGLAPGPGPVWL